MTKQKEQKQQGQKQQQKGQKQQEQQEQEQQEQKQSKRKKLNKLGEECYGFDFKLEKNIYCYLCCVRMNSLKLRNLKAEFRFDFYQQWKRYVRNNNEKFDKDKLIEFSRYLNLKIKNTNPSREYWNISATVLLSVIITNIFDEVLSMKFDLQGVSLLVAILIIEFLIVIPIGLIISQTMKPLFDSHLDENFLKDYKEIIDEIIKEREIT